MDGIKHGSWCVGCCWALMGTLLALAVALLLIVLALGVALVPNRVPGLTIPGDAEMSMDSAPTRSMEQ